MEDECKKTREILKKENMKLQNSAAESNNTGEERGVGVYSQLKNKSYRFLSKGLCFLLCVLVPSCHGVWIREPYLKSAPKTRTDNVKEVIHGIEITDPYRWLEDGNSPETRQWIESQNKYTNVSIGSLAGREALSQRLTELMRIDEISPALERNGRYFFLKRQSNQELYVICMRKGLKGEDEVLIDPHPLSEDHTMSVQMWDVSKDGSVMAYGVKQGGEDERTIKLFDVDKREDLPDRLDKARYPSVSLKPDNSGFYYVRHSSDGNRLYYHAMKADPSSDIELFGQGYGPDKFIQAYLSEDGRYLLIYVWHGAAAMKSEVYYQNIAEKGPILPIVNDVEARFYGEVADNYLFLHTNWKAPNNRILRVDLTDPARENWQEIIPECDAVLEEFSLLGRRLVVNYTRNVSSQLKVFEPDGKYVRDISLPAIGSAWAWGRCDSNEASLIFTSFHIPVVSYRYNVQKDTKEIWWQPKVPIDSNMFEVKQVWYQSKDGTNVPMFIVHRKGLNLDGQNPTLVTGYGGFNASLTPRFSVDAALWIEAGGVYAQPNLRGGGEFGEEWHKAGMLDKKQNVFDDFIAAAEWLIANGYTCPAKLAVSGGSNGGLLVGAALTQRPELFQAVVCGYPLLDMVRYHKFLIAQYWVSEYGSAEDPNQFKYLYAYSPYHNVTQGTRYPAVLFITGDLDTRVDPLHARKMVALLQSASGSHRPVLLRYHTKAGHSGGLPLSKQIEDRVDTFGFLFWQLGVDFSERHSLPALSSSR
jgi:prolyl oligopeptidase